MSRLRHKVILDLVRAGEIASQDDLMRGLKARHIEVSQSTLSRDIQELRLAKTGGVYSVVDSEAAVKPSDESFRRIIREFLLDVDVAQNNGVVEAGLGQGVQGLAAFGRAG